MKVGQLYDLNSFKKFLDHKKVEQEFKDSYAGLVLARNLQYVDPQLFEKHYPELAFFNTGIQADNSGGYAKRITSLRGRTTGRFTRAGDVSTEKGKIGRTHEDSDIIVLAKEAHSKWTDDEIKEAELQGVNLVNDYITGHTEVYQREVDEIGYWGITDEADSYGLLNHPSFPVTSAANKAENLTAQQMYDEIGDLIQEQWNDVNNTPQYRAVRVDMPVRVLNKLSRTILDTASSAASVLVALRANFPEVAFQGTFRAEAANGAPSRTVAYSNTRQSMVMRIPLPLQVGEIVRLGSWDYQVDSKYRIAGLDVLERTSGRILTGL